MLGGQLGAGPAGSTLPWPGDNVQTWLGPCGRVAAYVRSSGVNELDQPEVRSNLVRSLRDALPRARHNRGDAIVCLEGHRETLTTTGQLNGLVAGTRILGVGSPFQDDAPTITFAAGGVFSWVVDKANVTVAGLRLQAGASGGGLCSITAPGFVFAGNNVLMAQAGAPFATTIVMNAGAVAASFTNNFFSGSPGDVVSDGILVSDDGNSDLRITDNVFIGDMDASGFVRITQAIKRFLLARNVFFNTSAGASVAVVMSAAAAIEGVCSYNLVAVKGGGAITHLTTGFSVNAANLMVFFENRVTNDPRASGLLSPVVDT